ncbi:hypothetical protein J7S33_19205, partial [Saccharothrix algeriensis]
MDGEDGGALSTVPSPAFGEGASKTPLPGPAANLLDRSEPPGAGAVGAPTGGATGGTAAGGTPPGGAAAGVGVLPAGEVLACCAGGVSTFAAGVSTFAG